MEATSAQSSRARAPRFLFHLLIFAGVLAVAMSAYLLGRYTAPPLVSGVSAEAEPLRTQLTVALDLMTDGRYQEALDLLVAEAERHAEAQYTLGVMYERGQGVARDYRQAYQWYLKAAEQDHARAQYALASMYAYGYGVPRDTARAALWSSRAVENGYGQAEPMESDG